LATSIDPTRWPVSKADASKATEGALAVTVLTIITRTIDDVSIGIPDLSFLA